MIGIEFLAQAMGREDFEVPTQRRVVTVVPVDRRRRLHGVVRDRERLLGRQGLPKLRQGRIELIGDLDRIAPEVHVVVTERRAERHLDAVKGREAPWLVPLVGEAHVAVEVGYLVAGLK